MEDKMYTHFLTYTETPLIWKLIITHFLLAMKWDDTAKHVQGHLLPFSHNMCSVNEIYSMMSESIITHSLFSFNQLVMRW